MNVRFVVTCTVSGCTEAPEYKGWMETTQYERESFDVAPETYTFTCGKHKSLLTDRIPYDNPEGDLTLEDYQDRAQSTAVYPRDLRVGEYPVIKLGGEAGEVLNIYGKILRDGKDRSHLIFDELGDVLWYVTMVAYDFGWSLEDVATWNLEKLQQRAKEGTLKDR